MRLDIWRTSARLHAISSAAVIQCRCLSLSVFSSVCRVKWSRCVARETSLFCWLFWSLSGRPGSIRCWPERSRWILISICRLVCKRDSSGLALLVCSFYNDVGDVGLLSLVCHHLFVTCVSSLRSSRSGVYVKLRRLQSLTYASFSCAHVLLTTDHVLGALTLDDAHIAVLCGLDTT